MIEITGKIKTFNVQTPAIITPETMAETVKRPKSTSGNTYKLKPIGYDSALYLTINNITLNEGTEYEEIRPFEMFINTKEVDHFQWVTALTRVISAVFRKGGDINFLVEELSSIFDPKGGYWDEVGGKSKYVPSIIPAIISLPTPPKGQPYSTVTKLLVFITLWVTVFMSRGRIERRLTT